MHVVLVRLLANMKNNDRSGKTQPPRKGELVHNAKADPHRDEHKISKTGANRNISSCGLGEGRSSSGCCVCVRFFTMYCMLVRVRGQRVSRVWLQVVGGSLGCPI